MIGSLYDKVRPAVRRARQPASFQLRLCFLAFVVLAIAAIPAFAFANDAPDGEGATAAGELPLSAIEEAQAQGALADQQRTDAEVATELPHRDLGRAEALELLEGVFEPALQAPAGPFDSLDVERFLSNNAAVVFPPTVESTSAVMGGGEVEGEHEGTPALLESTVPLRVETPDGSAQAVDLTLEPAGNQLESVAPVEPVTIPQALGDGITFPESGIQIDLVGAPDERTPSIIEESVAAYPNVETDTDLAVAPTPTGVETLTTLRSADAPRTQSFRLDLPAGEELITSDHAGAEVLRGGETILRVQPPTAIDAAGDDVPVSMDVSKESLSVTVSPQAGTQYPILVDPLYESFAWRTGASTNTVGWTWINNSAYFGGKLVQGQGGNAGLNIFAAPGQYGYGNQAAWLHAVPRYFEEEAAGRPRPTSFITHLFLQGINFRTSPGPASPSLFAGIYDPATSQWAGKSPNFAVWVYPGNSTYFEGAEANFVNGTPTERDKNAKLAYGLGFLSLGEALSTERELWLGYATIETDDTDLPEVGIPTAPEVWVNNKAAGPIAVTAHDNGLGVKSVSFGSSPSVVTVTNPCAGQTQNPCPKDWTATLAATEYDPSALPAGFDKLPIKVRDVLGNESAATALIPVDHTAPSIGTLTGTLTEQAKLGTNLPQYTLKYSTGDGTEAIPQSGVASTELKVDGTLLEPKYAPGCPVKNCTITKEWVLESRKYSAGKHTVEVIATDGVGLSTSKTLSIELQPDSIAPSLSVTGSMTEQATLGTSRPQYKLKLRASDGTLAEATAAEGGPTAAYALDETSGTSARDAAANHTGTVTAPTWVEGKYGKALSFNGSSSCISVPNSVDLQLAGAFTLSAWVKPANTTQWAPIFYKEAESFYSYSLFFGAFEAGHVQGYVADKPWEYAEVESPGKLTANAWAHVAMTSDGTTLRLYVNGTQVDTGSAKTAMESKQPLLIGCTKNLGEYFNGQIDNVRIFNRALSAAEIETDKGAAVKVPAPEGPTAAYALDETSGTSAKDAAGTHTATVSGTASWVEGKYGKALNFNGENTCASVANSSDLQLNGPFTLEAWVKPGNTTQWAPIFYKEGGEFYGYSVFFGAFVAGHIQGYISEHAWEYTEVESPSTLTANTWAHVAMTSDGTTMRLYVNGTQVDTSPASKAIATTGPLLIGCAKNFSQYFKGAIDNVRIFNRALSAAEVEADKAAAVGTSTGPMQSGIAKAEITIDGTPVGTGGTSCSAENCSVGREWTLSNTSYPIGKHTIVAKVTDGFGNTTSKTTEIDVQRDTAKPTIEKGGTLANAPMGWVEQEGYGFAATAKDAGYGVTSLALKIDGTQVASSSASCADGGCEAAVQKTINMATYSGGAHPAEVVATDGAGNTSTQKWTINVDPHGSITADEVIATLEAVDQSGGSNVVGPSAEEPAIEGTAADLSFDVEGSEAESEGTEAPVSVETSPQGTITIQAAPPVSEPVVEAPEGEAEEPEQPPAEEPESTDELGQVGELEMNYETIEIDPLAQNGGATDAELAAGTALVGGNSASNVDTTVRPLFDGAMAFQDIRDASATETFSWEVRLSKFEEMRQVDEQMVGVYYPDGSLALSISAEPAHDVTGKAIKTTISATGTILTLTVHHHQGTEDGSPVHYPVLAGAGFEAGYATVEVYVPPPPASEEGEEEGEAEIDTSEGGPFLRSFRMGAPIVMSNAEVPAQYRRAGKTPRRRAYNFNTCFFTLGQGEPGVAEGTPDGVRYRASGGAVDCHGELEDNANRRNVVRWAASQSGLYWYYWDEELWLNNPPDCKEWGRDAPHEINCYSDFTRSHTHIGILGQYRFDPGGYLGAGVTQTCYEVEGTLGTKPPKQISGRKVIEDNFHVYKEARPWREECNWRHLHRLF